jgi:O-acetylserine/cysteine efflux transporter
LGKPKAGSPLTSLEWAAIVGIVLVWGVNNLAAKYSTEHIPPIFMGGLRFAVALLFLWPFIKPPFPDLKRLFWAVILTGPLNAGLIYLGFSMITSMSAFIVSLQLWVPFTALAAWVILGEAMGRLQIAGLMIAFGGIVWMTLAPGAQGDVPGILVGMLASVAWAMGTIMVRQLDGIKPLKLQGITALISAPLLLGLAFMTEPDILPKAAAAPVMVWGAVAWAAVLSTMGATAVMFWLVQRREPARIMPYFLTTPLVSSGLSVGLLGEHITLQVAMGGLATLSGVALVALSERRLARDAALKEAALGNEPI